MVKTVHIHIGPHKTGSTAIQEAFRSQKRFLAERLGIEVIHEKVVSEIAEALKNEDETLALEGLEKLSKFFESTSDNYFLSCEDFAGDLPGRSKKRRPYPRLWNNLNLIDKALSPNRCVFYFFVRDPDSWLKSAYVQNLKHRNRFPSLEKFREFLRVEELWEGVISKTSSKIGDRFVCISYREDNTFSSVEAMLNLLSDNGNVSSFALTDMRANRMETEEVIKVLESITRSSASNEAKRRAKKSVLELEAGSIISTEDVFFPAWMRPQKPDWLEKDLECLWSRVEQRVHAQTQPNLLPDPLGDLSKYRTQLVTSPEEFPSGGRGDMINQNRILAYRFNGLPKTCQLLGLTISYLRRQTEHTEHAAFLFQRLWEEEHEVLLGALPTRWLISTFQTFLDHGANEQQRVVGGSAYFFANLLKAYEAERALEGMQPDAVYPSTSPVTKNGFAGLDRFNLGGTDLMLNMNALLLEISSKDQRVGRVVQEFFLRLKRAKTLFSRMDRNRMAHDVHTPQFNNCWSFFERPK